MSRPKKISKIEIFVAKIADRKSLVTLLNLGNWKSLKMVAKLVKQTISQIGNQLNLFKTKNLGNGGPSSQKGAVIKYITTPKPKAVRMIVKSPKSICLELIIFIIFF